MHDNRQGFTPALADFLTVAHPLRLGWPLGGSQMTVGTARGRHRMQCDQTLTGVPDDLAESLARMVIRSDDIKGR